MIGGLLFILVAVLKWSRFGVMPAAWLMIFTSLVHAQAPLFSKPIDLLTQYRDRPLFSPSRRPAQVTLPVEDAAAPRTAQPLNAILLGLVSSSDGNGVVLLRVDGKPDVQHVRIGDLVNGWQLDRVGTHHAIFSSDGESVTLTFPTADDLKATEKEGVAIDIPADPIMPQDSNPMQP